MADQHGNASISAATKPKVVMTQPFIELPEMTRTLHEHQLFDEVCVASPAEGHEVEQDPRDEMLEIYLGLCWFPISKGRPSAPSLKAFSFEALLVLPEDVTGKAMAEAMKADWGEASECVQLSLPGDGAGLQEAWHQVYTHRCVAQEQSCLLLPGDRAEAFRWLSAMTNWFLGKRPVELTSEEPFWLVIELNGFTISEISSNLRLESCQGSKAPQTLWPGEK
ncbi:unnamed protein product [Cladocopium goreaui]|uniref:CS domain-containing protein n=1 Tax=Cladocopium goreaui TaxID=2562237 RepID=A0A9P1GTF4_9DINO|nr:unnamed protein product [Cladocopium goreaui]